jgi:hypothetical protein
LFGLFDGWFILNLVDDLMVDLTVDLMVGPMGKLKVYFTYQIK